MVKFIVMFHLDHLGPVKKNVGVLAFYSPVIKMWQLKNNMNYNYKPNID